MPVNETIGKTAAALQDEVMNGHVIWTASDNVEPRFIYRTSVDPVGEYRFRSQSRQVEAMPMVTMKYFGDLLELLDKNSEQTLVHEAVWQVLPPTDLRRCCSCEIPLKDGEMEAGMCYSCFARLMGEEAEGDSSTKVGNGSYGIDNVQIGFDKEPVYVPNKVRGFNHALPAEDPRIIIRGTVKNGYGGQVVLDVDGALNVLAWLEKHKDVLSDWAEDFTHGADLCTLKK